MLDLFTNDEIHALRAAWEASRETDCCDCCGRPAIALRLVGDNSFCLSCYPPEARHAS